VRLGLVVLAAVVAIPVGFVASSGSAAAKPQHPVACPSTARINGLPRWRAGGLLRGDVTGDRKPDALSIRFDKWAPGRCAFYLRITAGSAEHNLKLGSLVGDLGKSQVNAPIRSWPFRIPAVDAIVDLGGHGNLIVLGDNEGAADDFVDFVGFWRGRFRVIRMGLDLGGSVMSQQGASCSHGGPLRHWGVFNAWSKKHPHL
jgi:hypothetical protein